MKNQNIIIGTGLIVGAVLLAKKSGAIGSTYTNVRDSAMAQLKNVAVITKRRFPRDAPALRMAVNNTLDSVIRDIDFMAMREQLSQAQADRMINTLTNYAISLHR
jgi:hypothetical protein